MWKQISYLTFYSVEQQFYVVCGMKLYKVEVRML